MQQQRIENRIRKLRKLSSEGISDLEAVIDPLSKRDSDRS